MTYETPGICPECGADSFKTIDYDKKTSEMIELGSRFKRVLANHGLARAEWQLKEISLEESMRWLQRKTKKQALAIRKLEAKLKRLNEQPYKEEEETTILLASGRKLVLNQTQEEDHDTTD